MGKFIDKYESDVLNKKFVYDSEQKSVVYKLDKLFDYVIEKDKFETKFFSFGFFKNIYKKKYMGMYIWGDVGRGKTYLVDLFFYLLPIKKKTRLHFHHFMTYVHNKLKFFLGKKDPLKEVAKIFSRKYTVICLDEFFVKDIGDAMIFSKLFCYLFEYNMIFVITSNVIPLKLYYNGLQRQKFLQTILLIENNLDVVNIDGSVDYRLRNLEKENVYLYPLCFSNFKLVKNLFFKLSTLPSLRKSCIEILGRKIRTVYLSGSIIWFDFNVICGDGRSQLDYIEVASLFNTVFISGINVLTLDADNSVRRFIALIDEFYDRKINVILVAECDIYDLYIGINLLFDFKRTISRVIEMGTKKYLRESDKRVV